MGQNWAQNWVFWHFLKFGSLFFLEIACNDSLQQCLIYSREKIDEKFFWGPNLGHRDQNLFQNQVFCHFLKFGSLVFLEIAYNDRLQHYVTCSRGKIYQKKIWAQIWSKGTKIRPKTRFFAIFSSLFHQFYLKLHTMIACNNV